LAVAQRQVIHRLDFRPARGQNVFMTDEMSRRIEKLESHVAHLEHQVEQLNDVVTAQDKLLERLKKEVQRQSSAMETIELERIKANNPKPPHH
jgi:uncharacterized coiled-coil protein SlyX